MWQRLLFAIPIVLLPNALHIPFSTGVPAVNVSNLLLILAILAIAARAPGTLPASRGILTAPLLFLFASVLIAFVIALVTRPGSLVADITDLKNFLFYPLLYFVYRHCRQDLRTTRHLIMLTLAVAVLAGLESIWDGIAVGAFSGYNESKRIAGPFGGLHMANRAGVFYAMFLPLLVAATLFLRGRPFLRLVAIGGIAILIMAIMLTFSRQSYLIAVLTTGLLLLRRHLLLAGLLAVAMIPAISLLPQGVTERVAETQQINDIGEAELDVSTGMRFELWDGARRMWLDHPAGVGFGRFTQYIGDYTIYPGYDAHNIYVLMLAECGPLGLIALLWLLWRLLRLAFMVRRSTAESDSESRALGLGFALSVIAMAMGNLYGSPFHDGLVMANFWILCGLVEHYSDLKRQGHAAPAIATPDAADAIPQRFPLAAHIAPGHYRRQPK